MFRLSLYIIQDRENICSGEGDRQVKKYTHFVALTYIIYTYDVAYIQ